MLCNECSVKHWHILKGFRRVFALDIYLMVLKQIALDTKHFKDFSRTFVKKRIGKLIWHQSKK